VLELIDGWDLARVLERVEAAKFPLPIGLGLYLMAEVCRALAYAHGRTRPSGEPMGIVHRDVSPQNVLLSEQGEVKLADFGIAKAMTKRDRTATGVVKGKIAFMSPEQAMGAAIDARSDLFSFGTLIYLVTTGVRPFEAATDFEVIARVQRGIFTAPEEVRPEISMALSQVIKRSMSADREQRYPTADEMLVDLEGIWRSEFGAPGQTELKLWLAELGRRDGVPPIGRAPRQPTANHPRTLVGDLAEGQALVLGDESSGNEDDGGIEGGVDSNVSATDLGRIDTMSAMEALEGGGGPATDATYVLKPDGAVVRPPGRARTPGAGARVGARTPAGGSARGNSRGGQRGDAEDAWAPGGGGRVGDDDGWAPGGGAGERRIPSVTGIEDTSVHDLALQLPDDESGVYRDRAGRSAPGSSRNLGVGFFAFLIITLGAAAIIWQLAGSSDSSDSSATGTPGATPGLRPAPTAVTPSGTGVPAGAASGAGPSGAPSVRGGQPITPPAASNPAPRPAARDRRPERPGAPAYNPYSPPTLPSGVRDPGPAPLPSSPPPSQSPPPAASAPLPSVPPFTGEPTAPATETSPPPLAPPSTGEAPAVPPAEAAKPEPPKAESPPPSDPELLPPTTPPPSTPREELPAPPP
jgi:hypothetical protein